MLMTVDNVARQSTIRITDAASLSRDRVVARERQTQAGWTMVSMAQSKRLAARGSAALIESYGSARKASLAMAAGTRAATAHLL